MGAMMVTAGKAIKNAKPQAFSQIIARFSTKPTLNNVITKDIRHDIKNAIKKENTKRWYLRGSIIT
jgi:hypothetical protein